MNNDPIARLPEEWKSALKERGQPAYRAGQVFRWIHQRSVVDPAEMSDLPAALREQLRSDGVGAVMNVERVHQADDGSRKLLMRLTDGLAIETVLLPRTSRNDGDADAAAEDDTDETSDAADESDASQGAETQAGGRRRRLPAEHVSQCISTQVGCAMGCVFCASGVAGLKRHLSAGEIVSQLLAGRSLLAEREKLRSVVFMGMGEPLDNYDASARAIRLINHPEGLAIPMRRITISTSGLVPEIDRLADDFHGHVGLAISLHSADNARRSALMPINRRHPLPSLIACLRRYPMLPGRRVTIEYTLLAGQNDRPEDARAMAGLLKGLRIKINLIPMNPIGHSQLGPPAMDRVLAFQQELTSRGHLCFVRRRRGDDVSAACGQLVLDGAKPTASFLKRQPKDEA